MQWCKPESHGSDICFRQLKLFYGAPPPAEPVVSVTNKRRRLFLRNNRLLLSQISCLNTASYQLKVLPEREVPEADACEQMDLFVDYETMQEWKRRKEAEQAREKKIQSTVLDIKRRFGKNAILKGTALEDGATSRERNQKIGGHQA